MRHWGSCWSRLERETKTRSDDVCMPVTVIFTNRSLLVHEQEVTELDLLAVFQGLSVLTFENMFVRRNPFAILWLWRAVFVHQRGKDTEKEGFEVASQGKAWFCPFSPSPCQQGIDHLYLTALVGLLNFTYVIRLCNFKTT